MTINCVCCSQWDEIQKKIQSNMEAALFASMDKINGFLELILYRVRQILCPEQIAPLHKMNFPKYLMRRL